MAIGTTQGVQAPTSSTTPDRQTAGGKPRKPAARPRPRDPQAAVSTGEGDLDFDEPGRATSEVRRPKKTKPAKPAKPAPTSGRDNVARTKKGGVRAVPPEAGAAVDDGDDVDEPMDAYERVAAKMDEREGRKSPKKRGERREAESRDDRRSSREERQPERKPKGQPFADDRDDEEDDNLVVGDEIYVPGNRDDDDEDFDDDRAEQDDDEDDGFSKTILLEAKEYGFTKEEARAFGTPGNLENALRAIDRQMKQLGGGKKPGAEEETSTDKTSASGDTSTAERSSQDSGRAAEQEPPKKNLGTSATETAESGTRKPLTYEDLDPEGEFEVGTRTLMSKVLDNYNGIVAELEDKLSQSAARFESFVKHTSEMEYLRFMDEMDDFFGGLPKEYREVFGEGNYEDLDDETDKALLKNRREFVGEMNDLAKGIRQAGKPVPSRRKLRQRVLRMFGPAVEKREQQIRRETIDKVKKRDKHRIAEPTNRQGSGRRDLSPEDSAGEFADNFYRNKGYDVPRRSRDDDDDGI